MATYRFYKLVTVLIALVLILAPAAALGGAQNPDKPTEPGEKTEAETTAEKTTVAESTEKVFKVLMTDSGEVREVSEKEYVIGSVASEMSATCHAQALRAQAVACYTYAVRKRSEQLANPSEELKGAHITDSPATHQGYIPKSEREEKWGDRAEEYEEKLSAAVDDTAGVLITYDGEPILAAYHYICSGRTQSASTVWGEDIPYLQPVVSAGDKLSPEYSQTTVLTPEQFALMAGKLEGAELGEEKEIWLGKIKTTSDGYVTSAEIGGKIYTGQQVRAAFGLRSAVFTAAYEDGDFIFDVTGYGHSVGLSQYGADYMARQGSTYEEILKHYYTGVTVQ